MLPDIVGRKIVFEGSPVSPSCPSDKISFKIKVMLKDWFSETDRGKLKYSEKYQFPVPLCPAQI
jgi:hypothetical protein